MSKSAVTKCDKCGNVIEEGTGGAVTYTDKTNRLSADIHGACLDELGVHFTVQKKRGRKPKAAVTVA
jgi:hypothetical protein